MKSLASLLLAVLLLLAPDPAQGAFTISIDPSDLVVTPGQINQVDVLFQFVEPTIGGPDSDQLSGLTFDINFTPGAGLSLVNNTDAPDPFGFTGVPPFISPVTILNDRIAFVSPADLTVPGTISALTTFDLQVDAGFTGTAQLEFAFVDAARDGNLTSIAGSEFTFIGGQITAVPEPSAMLALVASTGFVALRRRRQRRAAA